MAYKAGLGPLNNSPTADGHVATKGYVDTVAEGLSPKEAVTALADSNVAGTFDSGVLTAGSNGALSIDGVSPAAGERVLLAGQSTAAQNGIYAVTNAGGAGAAYVLTRADDADSQSELQGAYTFVMEGTSYAQTGWVCSEPDKGDSFTINSTAISFVQFSGAGAMNLNGLTAAAVDVSADSIAIIDANNSNASRKESIADLVAAMAGNGLSAGSGQLSFNSSYSPTFATITASTAVVPDASGGADLGTTSLEWGDLYIGDSKGVKLGADQDWTLTHNTTGNIAEIVGTTTHEGNLTVMGTEGAAGNLYLFADQGDDVGDMWALQASADGNFSLQSMSGGSWQTELSMTNAGNLSATGSITSGAGLACSGAVSGATTINASGAITGGSLTDGTATLSSGALTGVTSAALSSTLTVGSDGSGADVTFYSATAGDSFLWDASEEKLVLTGTNGQNALEVADGDVKVVDKLYFFDNGGEHISSNGSLLTIAGATSHTGAAAFSSTVGITGNATFGADASGVDVTFHSATSGDYMMWDASEEKLVIEGTNAATALEVSDGNLVVGDGTLSVSGASTLSGALSIGGLITQKATKTAADTNVTATGVEFVKPDSQAVTVTLPTPALGLTVIVKDYDSVADISNYIRIDAGSGKTIDGSQTFDITAAGGAVTLIGVSTTQWAIV